MKINSQQSGISQQDPAYSAQRAVFNQNTMGRMIRPSGLNTGARVAISKEDHAARKKAARERINQKKKDVQTYIKYLAPHEMDYVKSLSLAQQNALATFTREDGGLDLPAFKMQQRSSQNMTSSNARPVIS